MTEKWFEPGKSLGWSKDDGQEKRIAIALKHRNGNLLKTARALQALSNVTKDSETKRKAAADAKVLFARNRKKKK